MFAQGPWGEQTWDEIGVKGEAVPKPSFAMVGPVSPFRLTS